MPPPSSAQLSSLIAHQGRVRALVRALLRDEHAAEDVVQEAWVRTLESGPRDPGALRTWFERVARSLALNQLRGRRRRDRRERDSARDEALPSSSEIASELELQRRLLDTVESLPEPHRSTLRDRYFGELTPTEIARRDGLPLDTVKSRLARARELLRLRLDESTSAGGRAWSVVFLPLVRSGREMSAPVAASATVSSTTLGVLAMKKIALAASVAVVSLVTWQSWPDSSVPRVDDVTAGATDRPAEIEGDAVEPQVPDTGQADAPAPTALALVDDLAAARRATAAATNAPWSVSGKVEVVGGDARPPTSPVVISLSMYGGADAVGDPRERGTVTTDALGVFSWTPSEVTGTVTFSAYVDAPGHLVLAYESVTVEDGDEPGSFQISITPRDATLYGTVVLPDGSPAAGAFVRWAEFAAPTNEQGEYELAVAPLWLNDVTAVAEGYGQDVQGFEGLQSGARARCDFELVPELRVRGVVRDEAGRPVAGASVRTFHGRGLATTTDETGSYELRGLPRAVREGVTIYARYDGLCDARESFEIPGAGDVEVDLVLRRGAIVAGRVVSPANEPLAGVELYIGYSQNAYGRLDATSDEDGAFVFPVVPSGPQRLWARAEGLATYEDRLVIPEDGAAVPDVLVEMSPGRVVAGVVRGRDGVPLEGVWVAGRKNYEYCSPWTYTDENGQFELQGLPDGRLSIEADGDEFVRTAVDVAAHQADGVVVVLPRAGGVRGRVIDGETGAPVTNFTIRFVDPILEEGDLRVRGYDATWSQQGRTFDAADGAWNTADMDLQPGRIVGIQASATGYAPGFVARAVVSERGSDDEVVVSLWKPVSLHVDVVMGEGRTPVASIDVHASQEERPSEYDRIWEGTTDTTGGVTLEDVPPGPLFVRIDGEGRLERRFGPFDIERSGSTQRIELSISGESTLVGVTRDDRSGDPVGEVPLKLMALEVDGVEHVHLDTTSTADGSFSFPHLPPGLYQLTRVVSVGGTSFWDLSLKVRIHAGAPEAHQDVRAPSGTATLSGAVHTEVAVPDRLKISLLSHEIDAPSRVVLSSGGRYEFTRIPPGKYMISTMHVDRTGGMRLMAARNVEVADGQRLEADLELAPFDVGGR